MVELIDILRKYPKNGELSTHSTLPGNYTLPYFQNGWSLYVPLEKVDEFNKLIYKFIFEKNIYFGLTETFGEISPLYIDIDLKYSDTGTTDRIYTDETLQSIVKLLREQIDEYLICDDEKYKECWIMEKKKPILNKNDGVLKDGIHIMFPYIHGEYKVFKYNFMKTIHERENDIIDIFSETSSQVPINDVQNIFDGNVSKWFMYGCGKANNYPYLLTKIIQYDDTNIVENYLDSKEIFEKTSLLKKFEIDVDYKNNLENLYIDKPLKKSTSSNSVSFMDSDFEDEEEDNDYDPYYVKNEENEEKPSVTLKKMELKNIYETVLNCLSVKRANEYDLWIRLGMCLKNIGGDELFKLWDEFSKKGSGYKDEADCQKFWDGFKRDGLTRATLHWWARMDNLDEYNKIMEKNNDKKIRDSIFNEGQHDDVAEVVYGLYKGEYICADLKHLWYYFNDTKWVACPRGWKLQKELTKRVKELYYGYHKLFKKEMDKCEENGDAVQSKTYDGYQKSAYSIYQKLKSVSYQNNIIESCKIKFFVEKVLDKFDANTMLMGFDNCVFDMRDNILREGWPDDYITMSNNINLPIHKNELPMRVTELEKIIQERVGKIKIDSNGLETWDVDKWDNGDNKFYITVRRDINRFFHQILPKKDLRKYCIKFIASRLSGNVLEQRFSIITGCGANGKSILIDLIRNVLGEYCLNLPVTLLTQKRKASNAACPEKAQTKGVRLCYMQEPDSGEKINAGEMKELTGGDVITARKLYQDVFSFKPQFELMLMCNEKPTIDDKTNGAWRRVQVYPFESRFVDDEKLIDEDKKVFRKDKLLSSKIKRWDVIFMTMLLEEWLKMDGGMNEDDIPDCIRMETEAYKNQNDMIGLWMSQDLVVSENTLTSFKELFESFESWKEENCTNLKLDKIDVKRRLMDWQNASKFGFSNDVNGSVNKPKFNFTIIQE